MLIYFLTHIVVPIIAASIGAAISVFVVGTLFDLFGKKELPLDLQKKFDQIMATLKELSDKVDALQTALDAEQEQIKNAIDTLTAEVEKLRTDVVDGGTAEERQALADKLDGVISDLQGTIDDAPTEPEV